MEKNGNTFHFLILNPNLIIKPNNKSPLLGFNFPSQSNFDNNIFLNKIHHKLKTSSHDATPTTFELLKR